VKYRDRFNGIYISKLTKLESSGLLYLVGEGVRHAVRQWLPNWKM